MVADLDPRVQVSKYKVGKKKRVSWSNPEVEAIAKAAVEEFKQQPENGLLLVIQYAQASVLPVERQRKIATLIACPNVVEKFKQLWKESLKPSEKPVLIRDMAIFSDEEVLREAGRRFDEARKLRESPVMQIVPIAPQSSFSRPKKKIRIMILGLEKYQFNHLEDAIKQEETPFDVKLTYGEKNHRVRDMNLYDRFIVMPHRTPAKIYESIPKTEIIFVNGGTGSVIKEVKELI